MNNNIPSNSIYIDMIGVKQEDKQKCLDVMQKYGDNKWWLSDDPKERAYYQINEDLQLIPFSRFHKDIEVLCDRPVWTHEFVSDKLRQEAERAWKYGVGATSDKERVERFEESVQELKSKGVDVVIVRPEE